MSKKNKYRVFTAIKKGKSLKVLGSGDWMSKADAEIAARSVRIAMAEAGDGATIVGVTKRKDLSALRKQEAQPFVVTMQPPPGGCETCQ